MGNLSAKLLDVGRCRSGPNRGGIRLLGVVGCLQRLPRSERLGKCSWPGRFGCSRRWWRRRDRAGRHWNWGGEKKLLKAFEGVERSATGAGFALFGSSRLFTRPINSCG